MQVRKNRSNLNHQRNNNKRISKMTKQKKITYLTHLFMSSEHFGDFDHCFLLSQDSLNYIYGHPMEDLKDIRDFFLDYTLKVWNYRLENFI